MQRNSNDTKRQTDQPNEGISDERQQSERPADYQQDAPE
jgi:hypothetical protein